ncbi:putative quinol monooxygenase [Actinoplanes oblitus]|uniref:Quinol monooxygenase n=1 Tax=Actinoplanes oblitus TaxID=3040509 RepID=A0ABY8W4Q3_9ACTN|nr:putative quinol monooxygenase [Actinoplanes oblitus]WIM92816.1 putative quinol monooxygenase [Actinoplanes oblitus]
MITCTLSIEVRPGSEERAIDTLSRIERGTRGDAGLIQFIWLRDEADPRRFLLFEQWATQADLDAHLAKDPSLWQQFEPALAGPAVAGRYHPVAQLTQPPRDDEVRDFARDWFDRLSRHEPVERLLPLLSDHDLEMVFPDATMTNEDEFRGWYRTVGEQFADQSHDLESIQVRPVPASADVTCDVVVVWRARQTADDQRIAARARQSWRLSRSPRTGGPVIVSYRVLALDDLAVPA